MMMRMSSRMNWLRTNLTAVSHAVAMNITVVGTFVGDIVMSMVSPVNCAVIGVGRMGMVHARILNQIQEVNVVAVVDSRPEAGASLARELETTWYASTEATLRDAAIEAWLIATPTPTHPVIVRSALEAGIHVLCEKPLSLDAREGSTLGRLAGRQGLVLQIGFWRRFSAPWKIAKETLDAGLIGDPVMIRLSQWDAYPPPAAFCDPRVSGGLAIDCGVHEFDLAEWFTGSTVTTVTGRNLRIVDDAVRRSGDVDNLVAMLDLENGVTAMVDLSRNGRYGDDVRTEILGSEGALLIDSLPTGRTRLATAGGIRVLEDSVCGDAMKDGIANQARAFASRVRGESVDVPTAEASTRAVAIGRAVQRASQIGSAEKVLI